MADFTIRVTGVEGVEEIFENFVPRGSAAALFVFEDWATELKDIAQRISPSDPLRRVDPRRNRPRFSLQWQKDVRRTGDDEITLAVGNTDPRLPFIIGPTSPRQIPSGGAAAQRRKGTMMGFYWVGGPLGPGWYMAWEIKGGVAGHGTEANPVHEKALDIFNIDGRLGDLADRIVEAIL